MSFSIYCHSILICNQLIFARNEACVNLQVIDDNEYSVASTGYRFVHGDTCALSEDLRAQFFADTDGKGHPVRLHVSMTSSATTPK